MPRTGRPRVEAPPLDRNLRARLRRLQAARRAADRIPERTRAMALELAAAGWTMPRIAEALGVSAEHVRRYLL